MNAAEIEIVFYPASAVVFGLCLWFAWSFCKRAGTRVGDLEGMIIVFFIAIAAFEAASDAAVAAVKWALHS